MIFNFNRNILPWMVICHCTGVREDQIRCTIRAGARSLCEVARACGAGTGCGTCCVAVAEILSEERAAAALRVDPEQQPAA